MKILSLSLGLAAIAFVSAQQADPMAAPGAQTTYEWASSRDQNELVARLEDLSYQVSEQALRIQFLSGPDVTAPKSVVGDQFSAQGPVCDNAASIASIAIDNTLKLITDSLGSGLGAPIGGILNTILSPIKGLLSDITGGGPSAAVARIVFAIINTVISLLKTPSVDPPILILAPVIGILETVKNAVMTLITCQASFGSLSEAQMFEQQSCYLLADIYRDTVADATKAFAALPTDVSEDLNRYLQGALAILENASKTSVAATNEALMATRPIFSADVLDQYRMEILRNSGDSDAVKMYAIADLGAVVAFSNGLEACLRIAADPAAAVEEANEEDDMDEDDMDEDDMDEDYEDEDEVGGEAEAADAQTQPQATDAQAQPQAADAQAQPQAGDAQAQPQAADAQAQPQATDAQAQPQAADDQAQPQAGDVQAQPQAADDQAQPQAGDTQAQPQAA